MNSLVVNVEEEKKVKEEVGIGSASAIIQLQMEDIRESHAEGGSP